MPARADVDIANMALLYAGVNQRISALTDSSPAAQALNTVYAEIRRSLHNEFRWPHAVKRQQLFPYFGNQYAATGIYNVGDLVKFGNNVYRSLLGMNLNNEPDLNSAAAWWAQVTRDGYAYVCPVPPDMLNPIAVWEKLTVTGASVAPLYAFDNTPTMPNLRNPRMSQRTPFKLENANDGTDLEVLLCDLDTPILEYTADVTNPSIYPPMFVETFAWHLAAPLAMGLRGDEKKAQACEVMATRTLADAWVIAMRDMQEDEQPVSEFEASREGMP